MTGKEASSNGVCATCRIELRPKTTDIIAVEMAGFGPYKLWHADLWECPQCHIRVVLGFAHRPFAEHYEPEFADVLAKAKRRSSTVVFWQNRRQKELAP